MYQRGELLNGLLTFLWYLRIGHQKVHWSVKGNNYYGDHLLFQRLYEEVEAEIDPLAEKILGLEGPTFEILTPEDMLKLHLKFKGFELIEDPYERSLMANTLFLKGLQRVFDALEQSGQLTMGLEDMLTAMASKHEEHSYLLQQRVGSKS